VRQLTQFTAFIYQLVSHTQAGLTANLIFCIADRSKCFLRLKALGIEPKQLGHNFFPQALGIASQDVVASAGKTEDNTDFTASM
jgi:hypothetical protein